MPIRELQLVENGPAIPFDLLDAHEAGNVVFFCGAGVSYRAGLRDFRWLVKQVYKANNLCPSGADAEAFKLGQYDRVLSLLEGEELLGPARMRQSVARALHLADDADLSTHKALLRLAQSQEDRIRLVTTNFDRGFVKAIPQSRQVHSAPALPSPAKIRWNSVVHLHGLVDETNDPSGADLVLTSGDFGRAYLVERWASTFAAELFRQYTVVFVGYSVKDPVIRYIVDAFAAEKKADDRVQSPYVFDAVIDNEPAELENQWKARGITPILYDPGSKGDHSPLHQFLIEWATFSERGYFPTKLELVKSCGGHKPDELTQSQLAVPKVLWALQEPMGGIARQFAILPNIPPVEWLDALSSAGMLSLQNDQGEVATLAGHEFLLTTVPKLNPITDMVGDWITRHLREPTVEAWLLEHNGLLHPQLRTRIRHRLVRYRDSSLTEAQYRLWWLVSSDNYRVKRVSRNDEAWGSDKRWDSDRRRALLDGLRPAAKLRPPFPYPPPMQRPPGVSGLAEVRIELSMGSDIEDLLALINNEANRVEILSTLVGPLTEILRETLELLEWLGMAHPRHDPSYLQMPTIGQSAKHVDRAWNRQIDLLRRCWDELLKTDSIAARAWVQAWRQIRYPIFKRLEMYARLRFELYPPSQLVMFLAEEEGWWLWSNETQSECLDLLRKAWPILSTALLKRLCSLLLAGPPREMYDWADDREFREGSDRSVWLRLVNLESVGRALPPRAAKRLSQITKKYNWSLSPRNRSELAVWVEDEPAHGMGPGYQSPLRPRAEIVVDLECYSNDPGVERDWLVLAQRWPTRALTALLSYYRIQGQVLEDPLRVLLERYRPQRSVRRALKIVTTLVESVETTGALRPAPSFLCEAAKAMPDAALPVFWRVWEAVMNALTDKSAEEASDRDLISSALASPDGKLADVVFVVLGKLALSKGEQLPTDIARRLERLLSYPGARTMVTTRLGYLWAVDPEWTRTNVVPYLIPEDGHFDAAAWAGYVSNANARDLGLLRVLKTGLVQLFAHRAELGQWYNDACKLFSESSILLPQLFNKAETRVALLAMDDEGLEFITGPIRGHLEVEGMADNLWRTRIGPWIDSWPKAGKLATSGSSKELVVAVTRLKGAFPEAVETIYPFLRSATGQIRDNGWVGWALAETTHPQQFPRETLKLLSATISLEDPMPHPKFREILDTMAAADPAIHGTLEFRKLAEYLDKHG